MRAQSRRRDGRGADRRAVGVFAYGEDSADKQVRADGAGEDRCGGWVEGGTGTTRRAFVRCELSHAADALAAGRRWSAIAGASCRTRRETRSGCMRRRVRACDVRGGRRVR